MLLAPVIPAANTDEPMMWFCVAALRECHGFQCSPKVNSAFMTEKDTFSSMICFMTCLLPQEVMINTRCLPVLGPLGSSPGGFVYDKNTSEMLDFT